MTDFICYMNEYGLVTTIEATAKLWAEAGTAVYVMRPDFMYGDVDLTYTPRPLSEVLAVHKEDTTKFPYAEWATEAPPGYCATCGCLQGHAPNCPEVTATAPLWALPDGEPFINPIDDAGCKPDPNGVSFSFDAGEW